MLIKAILLGLVGVFGNMDSRLLGRTNFEQPLVMSCLVGLVLGDLQKGLVVGVALELIFLGVVNIGAAAPPDMVLGSVIATAFAILSHTNAQTALTIALPVAILGQMIGIVLRMFMSTFGHMAMKDIDEGKFAKARSYHIIWGPILYALMYFVPIFLSVYFGTGVVSSIVKMVPQWLTDGLTLASKILPAFGFALLMQTMLSKKTVVYLLIGFFITAYGQLSVTGVAIFAVLLVLVLNEILPKKNTGVTSSDSSDDLEEL
ncbi:PTS mannose transporter subunit IICD [Bombilactobacillus bombi]|uniref:PTS mannose transporter subunit IICD n=1 Tax=Bombilactobacillus bombi TaxID=1303590 RepID=A0A417ZKD0_9LACO|nr:PTS sugar transporter subunit IIC [Bombilactobacillus bombi]RHW52366.1 PTS mannose transporter subunit IICD [Bombilactobacillus bombi]